MFWRARDVYRARRCVHSVVVAFMLVEGLAFAGLGRWELALTAVGLQGLGLWGLAWLMGRARTWVRASWCGLVLVLMVVLGWSTPAQAQLAVIDAANLVQNVVTAVQTVFMVANQILELTGLDEIVLGDDFQSDLEALGTIVQEARGLSYDMSSLQAQVTILFSLDSAPNSAHELRERLAAIRRVVFDSYLSALRTQTLLKTTLSTVRHLTRLVSAIGAFVGNMQGNQTMAQMESTLSETLARLQVQTAAYERAQSVERLTEPLTMESLHRINDAIMVDHPQ